MGGAEIRLTFFFSNDSSTSMLGFMKFFYARMTELSTSIKDIPNRICR